MYRVEKSSRKMQLI